MRRRIEVHRSLADACRLAGVTGGDRKGPHPLTFAQERMWVGSQLVRDWTGGVSISAVRVLGPLDVPLLSRAINRVVARHPMLRTRFADHGDRPHQVVEPYAYLDIPLIDWTGRDPAEATAAVAELADEAIREVCLDATGLLRLKIVRLAAREHVLVVAGHHIVVDGWSTAILGYEVGYLYATGLHGATPRLPDPPATYVDYAHWQRDAAERGLFDADLAYWKRCFHGEVPVLGLPHDRPRPLLPTFEGESLHFEIPGDLRARLSEVSRAHQCTLFMTLLAGFKVMLAACTGQDDLVVGCPSANRVRHEIEWVVGCFMHPLILRTNLGGAATFSNVLRRVRQVCLSAYAHQDAPFELIVRELRPRVSGRRTPPFQVLFNLLPQLQPLEIPELTFRAIEMDHLYTPLDLSVHLTNTSDSIFGIVEFSSELFDAETIQWLIDGYRAILEHVGGDSAVPVDTLFREVMARGRRQTAVSPPQATPSQQAAVASSGQQRLWLAEQLDRGGCRLQQTGSCDLIGPLDEHALQRAIAAIVRRHEVLRTGLFEVNGEVQQRIESDVDLAASIVDLRGVGRSEQHEQISRRIRGESQRPFDLGRPPLARLLLFRCGPEHRVAVVTVHHVVTDGWSLHVVREELRQLYQACLDGHAGPEGPLPRLAIQYRDYARWQQRRLRGPRGHAQLAYWKRQLAAAAPEASRIELSGRGESPPESTGPIRFTIADELAASLERLAADRGATLYTVLLALWQVVVWRYSGATDVLVDTPVAGRDRAEWEGLIGFFVNSLLVRTRVDRQLTFCEFLNRVQTTCLDAFVNQEAPIDRVVAAAFPDRTDRGVSPAQNSFMLHVTPSTNWMLAGDVEVKPHPGQVQDEFPLTMILYTGRGLHGELNVDPDVVSRRGGERIVGSFLAAIQEVAADPVQRLGQINLLAAGDRESVTERFNRTARVHSPPCRAHELFEMQARRTPDAVAAVLGATEVTYQQLDDLANHLAVRLRASGSGNGDRIALRIDRTLESLVGLLGIFKAGGACVPLDMALPSARAAWILADANVSAIVTRESLREDLRSMSRRIPVVLVDGIMRPHEAPPEVNGSPVATGTAADEAYVIYTSGSTGTPKGVSVSHRNLVNHNRAVAERFGLTSADRVWQFHPLGFDAAFEEILPTWSVGASLVLRGSSLVAPGSELEQVIERERLTVVNLPTAYWHEWARQAANTGGHPDAVGTLRLVIVGGERAATARYLQWRDCYGDRIRWLNTYGPTEATIIATIDEPPAVVDSDEPLPIGRPIDNVEVYVLDEELQPLPLGVVGEIVIGGAGVAGGYLGMPQRTAERFVADTFKPGQGRRLFRTGDRGRFREDGRIEYCGRTDRQLKVRGFRIEPGEIETVLMQHCDVADAIVVSRPDTAGDEKLEAIVAAAGLDAHDLAEYLAARLPRYMVPAAWHLVPELPRNLQGKVDLDRLPDAKGAAARPAYVPPRTPTEQVIAAIWASVLGVAEVGVSDDFFGLGGHSLKAGEIVFRIREALGVDLPLAELFTNPTVAGLAAASERLKQHPQTPPLIRGHRPSRIPLSFAQEGAWILDQLQPQIPFVIPVALRITGPLDANALDTAFRDVCDRHEVLRTTFFADDGIPAQRISDGVDVGLESIDLSHVDGDQQDRRVVESLLEVGGAGMDLAKGPLIRLVCVKLGRDRQILLLVAHHIVFDGWSLAIFARELFVRYTAIGSGDPARLGPPSSQYADYAIWQRERLRGDFLESQLAYWRQQLAGCQPGLAIPEQVPHQTDADRGHVTDVAYATVPADVVAEARAQAVDSDVTWFMYLLAAFKVALARCTGQADLVVATPIATRNQPELASMIGFCVNLIPLRTDLGGRPPFRDVLSRVRETCLAAYAHQDVPLGLIVQDLAPRRVAGQTPFVAVQFAMQYAVADAYDVGGLRIEPYVGDRSSLEWLRSEFGDVLPASEVLSLVVLDQGDQVTPVLHYRGDLMDAAFADRVLKVFEEILTPPDSNARSTADDIWPDSFRPRRHAATAAGPASERPPYRPPQAGTERQLAKLFREILEVERVGGDDDFFALGGHSLQATRMVSRIHDQFSVDLPLRSVWESPTPGQLASVIDAALLRGESSLPAAHSLTLHSGRPGSAVRGRASDARSPLYLLPALDGQTGCYLELARLLPLDRDIVGLQHPALTEDRDPELDLESLASRYAETILAATHREDCYVAGWSVGGVLAHIVARRLAEAGKRVRFVGLIDATLPSRFQATIAAGITGQYVARLLEVSVEELRKLSTTDLGERLARTVERFAGTEDLFSQLQKLSTAWRLAPEQAVYLLEKIAADCESDALRAVAARVASRTKISAARRAEFKRIHAVIAATASAFSTYRAETYEGRVDLFASRTTLRGSIAADWERLSGQLTRHTVGGDHFSMLHRPYVATLAAAIRRRIERLADPADP